VQCPAHLSEGRRFSAPPQSRSCASVS
jgi:hypothetical protein